MKVDKKLYTIVWVVFMLSLSMLSISIILTPEKYESTNPCRECENLGFLCSDPYLYMRNPRLLNISEMNLTNG